MDISFNLKRRDSGDSLIEEEGKTSQKKKKNPENHPSNKEKFNLIHNHPPSHNPKRKIPK